MALNAEIVFAALDELPQALMLLDGAGTILFANAAFERLVGGNWESVKDQPLAAARALRFAEVAPPLIDGWCGEVIWSDGEAGESQLFLELRELELRNAKAFLVLFSSPSKEANRNRRRERLESLGRLAGGIAHDLNNILTGILGHVAFLNWAVPREGEHAESLKAVEDGARRAASLLNQILEFAKGEQAKLRMVNLTQLSTAALSLFRAALPSHIELEIQTDGAYHVFGDEGQLSQLVMNLAVNARDALADSGRSEAGKISVQIARRSIHDFAHEVVRRVDFVTPSTEDVEPGVYVCLSVGDNGTGIARDVLTKIFEPFFTTKAKKGTGLGLSNVSAIVQRHHGFLAVESEVGTGSIFSVYLPECQPENNSPSKEDTIPTGGERILVVEDEDTVRTVMQRCLEHLGYAVDVAANGVLGVEKYCEAPKSYQLVILDMMMPGMSGDEVFVRLKEINPDVRVLISSGYSTDGRAQAVIDSGGMGFIPKPFAIEDLAREVRRCLDTPR